MRRDARIWFCVVLLMAFAWFGCISSPNGSGPGGHSGGSYHGGAYGHGAHGKGWIRRMHYGRSNANLSVKWGDLVTFDYAIYINQSGNLTLYDTSLASLAHQWNLSKRGFRPLTIVVKKNNGMIPALNFALLGMKEGEHKRYSLSPEEAFGPWDPSKVQRCKLTVGVPRVEEIPKYELLLGGVDPKKAYVGEEFNLQGLPAVILNISNNSAIIGYTLKNGSKVFYEECERISKCTDDKCLLTCLISNGRGIVMENGKKIWAKVLNITNDTVAFDLNPPLAGKWIVLDLWLRHIVRLNYTQQT